MERGIGISRAQANDEEAAIFSCLALSAGGRGFRAFFGEQAAPLLERLYRRSRNYFSYELARWATLDGQPVGLMSGYSAEEKAGMKVRNYAQFAIYGMAWLPQLMRGAMRYPRVAEALDTLPPKMYYIQFLAVEESAQGRGLSQILLDCAAEEARQRGCEAVALDVEIENHRAFRVYRRWGMDIATSSAVYPLEDGYQLGLHRMVKAI